MKEIRHKAMGAIFYKNFNYNCRYGCMKMSHAVNERLKIFMFLYPTRSTNEEKKLRHFTGTSQSTGKYT